MSGAAALYAASFGLLSVLSFERAEAAITVLWAAVALALLLAGLAFRSLNLHWAGLALFTIAALKLVFFDVGELSDVHSAWAGLGFGLLRSLPATRKGSSAIGCFPSSRRCDSRWLRSCSSRRARLRRRSRSSRCSTARPAAWTSRVPRCSCSRRCTARSPRRCSAGPDAAISRRSSGVSARSWPRTASRRISWTDSGSCSRGPRSAPVSPGSGAATRDERFLAGSAALVGLALAYAIGIEAPPDSLFAESARPAAGVPSLCFAGLGLVALALCMPDGPLRRYAAWITGAVVLFAGSLAILGAFQWLAADNAAAVDAASSAATPP